MVQLTVGYVAGFIAIGVYIANLWSPTILSFILSGFLGDKSSAATWTLAGSIFQRSYWPVIFRSDSFYTHGVPRRIAILSALSTLMSVLIGIVGFVTPLGLYETLEPGHSYQAPFRYLRDSSAYGLGTPSRSNYSFARICLDPQYGLNEGIVTPCPFSDTTTVVTTYSNGTISYTYPYSYDLNIPQVLIDTYSSGTSQNTTASNFFDIQWRQYYTTSNPNYNNGSTYLSGSFRSMESVIMNNNYQVVEGLVVDTIDGGIGYRNHTVPPVSPHELTWEEDLLFIEPETACVDTNLTIDYTVSTSRNNTSTLRDVVLTDRGGIANLDHKHPKVDLNDRQSNADLRGRAYIAAWLNNYYTALYYNATDDNNSTLGTHAWSYVNSFVGKTYQLYAPIGSGFLDVLTVSPGFGDYLQFGVANSDYGPSPAPSDSGAPTNPFNVTESTFSNIMTQCTVSNSSSPANISNIYIACGLMHGIPQRQDSGSQLIFDSGSRWSQPLYTCASAVKATKKTVSFKYNATSGRLQDLNVTNIRPTKYSDARGLPLWGVENTGNRFTNQQIDLIWGLVSSEYNNSPNVSTVAQEYLYLPGYMETWRGEPATSYSDNLPGSEFYKAAMIPAYNIPVGVIDYSGSINMAMWARWQNLTQSAETAALILNLIWTDTAASSVVGTKGVLGPMNTAQKDVVPIQVTPTVSKIKYHYPFAIPAFLAAVLLMIITVAGSMVAIFGRGSFATLRRHIQILSPGRIFTTFLYPESGAMTASSKVWSEQMAMKVIDISGEYPATADSAAPPEKDQPEKDQPLIQVRDSTSGEDPSTNDRASFLSEDDHTGEGLVRSVRVG